MHCKNCKHSRKSKDHYEDEHSKGLLFCRKVVTIDEDLKVKDGYFHVFDGDNGEGIGNNVNDFVHENYGCIHFENPSLIQ